MRKGKLPGDQDEALHRASEALRGSVRPDEEAAIRQTIQAEMKEEGTGIVQGIKDTITAARRLNKAFDIAARGLKTIRDYTGPVGRVAGWAFGRAVDIFKFAAFERENGDFKRDKHGDLIFSGTRLTRAFALAAGVTAATLVGAQVSYYQATRFDEIVYVTGKQEIRDGELYHVTGCTSLPCSTQTDNGKYYQIQKSWFAPHQLYPEENIYANIPQTNAACHVRGYGIYFKELKPIHRFFNFYQNLESASCIPLTEQDIQNAVGQGRVFTPEMFRPPAPQTQP